MECEYNEDTRTLTISYTNNSVLTRPSCYTDKNIEKIKVVGDFEKIGDHCFSAYRATITSPTTFENNIITGLKIKSLHLPKSLITISTAQPFDWCDTLESFTIDDDNEKFKVVDGVLFSKDGSILYFYPNGRSGKIYNIPFGTKELFNDCFSQTKFLTHIIIPTTVNYVCGFLYNSYTVKNVTILRCPCDDYLSTLTFAGNTYEAFQNCSIIWKNVSYNETLSTDGKTLTISPMRMCNGSYYNIDFDDIYFSGNKELRTVIFEEGISKITAASFTGCSNLKRIVFPRTIKHINANAFKGCKIMCNSIIYSSESKEILLQYFSRNSLEFCNTCKIDTGSKSLFVCVCLFLSS